MYKKALKEYSIKNCSTVQQNCVKKIKNRYGTVLCQLSDFDSGITLCQL